MQQVPPVAAKQVLDCKGMITRKNHTEGGRETGAGLGGSREMKLVISQTKFLAAKLNLYTNPAAGFRHLD